MVILDDYENNFSTNDAVFNELKRLGQVEIFHKKMNEGELIQRNSDVNIIIPLRERTQFSAELLSELKNLKLIAQTGTGLAHIDQKAANQLGISIMTTPGGSTASMTELTFTLILALSRNLLELSHDVRQGNWPMQVGIGLQGKTLGIIGLGKIGKSVAGMAKLFGMKVIAWGPRLTEQRASEHQIEYVTKETLLKQSHFVTLHVRLVEETHNLLDAKDFEIMRKDAFLVNTSRGKVVSESALIEALKLNKIRGAGLDVLSEEPPSVSNEILTLNNVIITPHIGWKTDNTFQQFMIGSVKNTIDFIKGSKGKK